MKISDLYVVEWNEELNQFHVATVAEMLAANKDVFLADRNSTESGWLVLAVESNYDAAHAELNRLKALLDAAPPH